MLLPAAGLTLGSPSFPTDDVGIDTRLLNKHCQESGMTITVDVIINTLKMMQSLKPLLKGKLDNDGNEINLCFSLGSVFVQAVEAAAGDDEQAKKDAEALLSKAHHANADAAMTLYYANTLIDTILHTIP